MRAGGAKWAELAAEREAQLGLISDEKRQLASNPDAERDELIDHRTTRGLEPALAAQVADQLNAHDALGAHTWTRSTGWKRC